MKTCEYIVYDFRLRGNNLSFAERLAILDESPARLCGRPATHEVRAASDEYDDGDISRFVCPAHAESWGDAIPLPGAS
jgi:hypothetical protein